MRVEMHSRDDILAEALANHEKEVSTFRQQLETARSEAKFAFKTVSEENDLLKQRIVTLQKSESSVDLLLKQVSEGNAWKKRYEEMKMILQNRTDSALEEVRNQDMYKLKKIKALEEEVTALKEEKAVIEREKIEIEHMKYMAEKKEREILEIKVMELESSNFDDNCNAVSTLTDNETQSRFYKVRIDMRDRVIDHLKADLINIRKQMAIINLNSESKRDTSLGRTGESTDSLSNGDSRNEQSRVNSFIADLQTKLMEEYNNTLREQENALNYKTNMETLQRRLEESDRDLMETDLKLHSLSFSNDNEIQISEFKTRLSKSEREKDRLSEELASMEKRINESNPELCTVEKAFAELKSEKSTCSALLEEKIFKLGEAHQEVGVARKTISSLTQVAEKKEIEQREKIDGNEKLSQHPNQEAIIQALKSKIEIQHESFGNEQRLIASIFHEIGLRYHQLLCEYRAVLKRTGAEDKLFLKNA